MSPRPSTKHVLPPLSTSELLSDVTDQIHMALHSLTCAQQCLEKHWGMAEADDVDRDPSMPSLLVSCSTATPKSSMLNVSENSALTEGGNAATKPRQQPLSRARRAALNFKEMLAEAEQAIGMANILEPQAAKAFLEANPDTLYLDVQEEGTSWVPGTHRTTLGQLFEKASSDSPELADSIIANRKKDAPVLVTCSTGRQAKLAAKLLTDYGFTNVKVVQGGWSAWKSAMMSQPLTLPSGWPQTVKRRRGLLGMETVQNKSAAGRSSLLTLEESVGETSTRTGMRTSTRSTMTSTRSSTRTSTRSTEFAAVVGVRPTSNSTTTTLGSRLVLSPASLPRILLDMCSVLALAFDLVTVPWMLAWEVPIDGWLASCSLALATFWTMDILASFRTGFYSKGEVQMNPRLIALRYLKTWFAPDLIMVVLDWSSIFLFWLECSSNSEGGRGDVEIRLSGILRFAKWSRFLRLAGVARFIRFSDIIERISDRSSQSPQAIFAFQTFNLLFVILYVNHFGACVWWAIGRVRNSNTGVSWVDVDVDELGWIVRNSDKSYQYVVSLHWAVSQILGGNVQVNAVNTPEHIFSVMCLIFGVLFFSSLVSMLTSKMTQMRVTHQDRTAKLRQLRDFLRTKGVRTELAVNITKQVGVSMVERKPDTPSDLQVWPHFSQAHKTELHRELCMPHLLKHPFFLLVAHIEGKAINRLCDKAVTITVHSHHDVIFTPGNSINEAYMVVNGNLRYSQDEETSMVSHPVNYTINEGAWICEAALWTLWMSVGTLEATSVCELIVVKADKMVEVFSRNLQVCQVASEYSRGVFMRVRAAKPPAAELPSDISVPFASHAEVMASMTTEIRAFAGLVALQSLTNSTAWLPGQTRLRRDVCEGARTAALAAPGEVELVSVSTSLRLRREDGKVLSQLGIWDGQAAVPTCQLPTTWVRENEVPWVAAQRLLQQQLAPLVARSRLKELFREYVDTKETKFSVPERAFRIEYDAELDYNNQPEIPRAGHAWGREMSRHSTQKVASGFTIDEVLVIAGASDNWREPWQDFQEEEVDRSTLRLLTWLEPEHLEWLSSSAGQVGLRKFLSSVSVSREAKEDAMDLSSNPRWHSSSSWASSDEDEADRQVLSDEDEPERQEL